MKKNIQKGKKASGTSKAGNNKKRKPGDNAKDKATGFGQESLGDNYWDRVAEDAGSGYKSKNDEDRILNEDQQQDDHMRGDQAEKEQ